MPSRRADASTGVEGSRPSTALGPAPSGRRLRRRRRLMRRAAFLSSATLRTSMNERAWQHARKRPEVHRRSDAPEHASLMNKAALNSF